MRYSNLQTREAAQVIPFICAACFVLFSFLYLYCFQSDFIAQEQYFFSQGVTSYNPLLGSLVTTLILVAIGGLISRFVQFPIRLLALAWSPSCYLLGLLCCLHFNDLQTDKGSSPVFLLILFPLLYAAALYLCRIYHDLSNEHDTGSAYLAPNLIVLLLSFVLTIAVGNSESSLHHELRVANQLRLQHYDEALEGMLNYRPTRKLNEYKVYALTQQSQLGERLFQFPLLCGSYTMLPPVGDTLRVFTPEQQIYHLIGAVPSPTQQLSTTRFLQLVFERDTTSNPRISQLLLSAFLLDKDLKSFARYYAQIYDTTSVAPRYFREAAILYNRKYSKGTLHVNDEAIETNFQDFTDLMNSYPDQAKKQFFCHDMFADTYWYYYFFVRNE